MADLFPRDSVQTLIKEWRAHECLWNVKSIHYRNRMKKDKAYQEVLMKVKETVPSATLEIIKRRMHTLRGQFNKEVKAVAQSQKSGAGTVEIYQPKLWCFNELKFLKEFSIIRESQSSLQVSDQKQNSSSHMETYDQEFLHQELERLEDIPLDADLPAKSIPVTEETSSTTTSVNLDSSATSTEPTETLDIITTTVSKPTMSINDEPSTSATKKSKTSRKRHRSEETNADILMKKALQELDQLEKLTQNKFSVFGSSIANDLSQMDGKQAIIAKKLINDIISMGSLNLLNENWIRDNPLLK